MGTITYADALGSGLGMVFGFIMVIVSGQLQDKHPQFAIFGVLGMLFALVGFILFMYKFFKKDKPETKNPHGTLPKGYGKPNDEVVN